MKSYYIFRWLGLICSVIFPSLLCAQSNADFNYQMTGDKRVAPVQVFDDGTNTYLQFRAGQVIPAIFASQHNSQPLSYEVQGPYIFVPGLYQGLLLQLQQLTAGITYTGQTPRNTNSGSNHALHQSGSLEIPATEPVTAPKTEPETVVKQFEVSPSDNNLRLALMRWAQQEGWVFSTELWQVPVDIPIAAMARFSGDFKQATRALLKATELSPHPLQPCFYSNNVLRVVPVSERCDRSRSAP